MCMSARVCSLVSPACNAYAPYCDVICGPSDSTTFLTLSYDRHDFLLKKSLNIKCVFRFSLQLLTKPPLTVIVWRDILINVKTSSNPSSGSRVVTCERTDMKRRVTFRNSANTPKNHTKHLFPN